MRFLLLFLFALPALAQNLTVTVPSGCTATPATVAVTCGVTPPPAVCPPGQTGTPPNCVTPPPSSISCPGFPGTLVINQSWTNNGQVTTAASGGWPAANALVIVYKTPAAPVPPPTKGKGGMNLVEYQGPVVGRTGSLSMTPCDFTGGINGKAAFAGDTAPTVYWTFGYSSTQLAQLQPLTTYYLNVYNNGTCTVAQCNMIVTLTTQ